MTSNLPTYHADIDFHRAVARASHNNVFTDVLDALTEQLTKLRQATDAVPGAREIAVLGHTKIYDAIVVRNPQQARFEMRDHILTAFEALKKATSSEAESHLIPGPDMDSLRL